MDLKKFSQKTKQEAEYLLKYGDILNILSRHGKPVLTGSYKYDLMWGPDIDLVVITDKPEQEAYEALKDFIEQRKFQKYQLGDFIKFPRNNRPHGVIVVLILEYEGRKWEIEIWFNHSMSENDDYYDKMLLNASEEQRKTILELKQQRESDDISKHKLDSTIIYKGVILEGKNSLKDFNI